MTKLLHSVFGIAFLSMTWACQKDTLHDFEYAVICDFKPAFADRAFLLVTNREGDVIQEIDVQAWGLVSLTKRFTLQQEVPYSTFDIHLVLQDTQNLRYQVFSHFGVKNGQSIFFSPEKSGRYTPPPVPPTRNVEFRLTGVKVGSEVIFPGCDYTEVWKWPVQDYDLNVNENLGLLIQYRPDYFGLLYQIYVPTSELKDSMVMDVQEILLPTRAFQVSSTEVNDYLNVTLEAVSPDLMRSMYIEYLQTAPSSSGPLMFMLPENLDPNLQIRLHGGTHYYAFDTLLPSTQFGYLLKPSIEISEKQYVPGKHLAVKTKGEVDFVKISLEGVVYLSSSDYRWVEWQLEGAPSQFSDLNLPKLQPYFPPGMRMEDVSKRFEVEIFRSGQYGYPDVARGFPWRSTTPLATASGGYEWAREK